jgi:heterotetrameric sarcosine oxidase delta subunit
MRVRCPFCGERDSGEFSFAGDASCRRPDAEGPDDQQRFYESVYVRNNPAGRYEELWYHASGCKSWLRVTRDTRTHEVHAVEYMTKVGD